MAYLFDTTTVLSPARVQTQSLSPMKHLPYDVLREIITHSSNLTMKYNDPEFEIQVLAPPIAASQVCRSWRRDLLSDSTMWTCLAIPQIKPDWIMELLRRSGSAPLNVFLHLYDACESGYKVTLDMIITLFDQIHRFSVLRLQINYWEDVPFEDLLEESVSVIMSSIQRPAPMLQTFSFAYDCLQNDKEVNPDYTVIENLFSGIAPNLKRVHHRLSIEPQETRTGVFSDLLELCLAIDFSMQPDLFFDLLEASPRLKMLRIYAEDQVNLDQFSDRKAHLPYLERLTLEMINASDFVNLFMNHATFPLNVKWRISILHSSFHFEESPILLRLLSQTRFTFLYIQVSQTHSLLRFEEIGCFSNTDQSNGNALVCKYLSSAEMVNLLDPLMRIINSHVTHVELEPDNLSIKYGIIPFICARLTWLRSLTILSSAFYSCATDESRITCLAALLMCPDKNMVMTNLMQNSEPDLDVVDSAIAYSPQTMVLCPSLHTVILRLSETVEIRHAEIIAKCLSIRRRMGHPLGILLGCPGIHEDALQRLERSKSDGPIVVYIMSSK